MTTSTVFPSIDPTFTTDANITARTLEAAMGNGYEQRVGDGLNTMPEIWSVVFEGISWTDCITIKNFLKGQGGSLPFMWTPPGESALQVKCKSWKRVKTSPNTGTVTTSFEQVFDL